MLIFDIGANIGKYAIANNTNDNKIICVEASPNTYEKLVHNVQTNKNITVLHYAVSSKPNNVIFYHCTEADTLSTLNKDWLNSEKSRFGFLGNKIQEVIVNTITLDSLIVKYGIPDLCKIDVEGAEEEVIKTLSFKNTKNLF